jgi:hypothetical protein
MITRSTLAPGRRRPLQFNSKPPPPFADLQRRVLEAILSLRLKTSRLTDGGGVFQIFSFSRSRGCVVAYQFLAASVLHRLSHFYYGE